MKIYTLLFFILISQIGFTQNNKQQIATQWISENIPLFGEGQSLNMTFSRRGPAGETFRFYHTMNGIEIFDSSIAVHVSKNNVVSFHANNINNAITRIDTTPILTKDQAMVKAANALNITGAITQREIKLYVYNHRGESRLVYRITTISEFLNGYWETIIDAKNGEVLSTRDIAIYHKPANPTKPSKKNKVNQRPNISMLVDGTAMVFDTDPLTVTTNTYGGNYSDNNDATNADLDAARVAVILPEINFDGTLYSLSGPYVEIAELQAPSTGLFQQDNPDFVFDRQEQGFEAANCYYHIDKSMRYINDELGIPLQSLYNGGVIRYDPHGFNGADNSSYGGGSLNFGEGGVDDGEDADVILHELGHGLHDWVTNGSLSQVDGLSEGTGDYWANSYKRSLGHWADTDPSYYYVFGWDGHNPFWPGRVTNYGATYPGGLTGSIHTDGQIWATVLLEIWEIIGRDKTDAAVLEGLAMTNNNTGQQDAAIAVRQAAIDMGYTCDDIAVFTDRFEARGYTLPVFDCDPTACTIPEMTMDNLSGCDDNGTPSDASDDFSTADITITFENAPTNGTLNLSGDATASISVTGLTSPHTFIGVILPADGTSIDISASFSETPACAINNPAIGTAPECEILDIIDNDVINKISFYPNPASETITIVNLIGEEQIEIYNLLGQKVKEQPLSSEQNSIDVSLFPKGIYLIRIQGYNQTLKLVKE